MTKGRVFLVGGVCAALICLLGTASGATTPVAALCAVGQSSFGQVCPCNGDTDGSGLVQIQDLLLVVDCINGIEPAAPLTCATAADVNCDGVIDYCDVSSVYCHFVNLTDCCAITCGACCNSGANFNEPCLVGSQLFCESSLLGGGRYLGDGTVCDPWPCDAIPCTADSDCDDANVCTVDICADGTCVSEPLPDGASCADGSFCDGEETCLAGICRAGEPPNCDDGLACTEDHCDEALAACLHTPIECNNDGVCESPCESSISCPGDCAVCACVLDQDGSGGPIKIQDVINVVDCAEGVTPTPPLTCDYADLDCDGDIDYCDVSRVVCGFMGSTNCCEADIPCGACCNAGTNFNHPCLVISRQFCESNLIVDGSYLGDGIACEPWPCDTTGCTSDSECDDQNVCTTDVCLADGTCLNESVANGTPCPDDSFCNGVELCFSGICQFVDPLACDDGLSCTTDSCDEVADTCVNIPAECNNDGVCDSPCEYSSNCPGDCGSCTCVLDQDGSGEPIQITDMLIVVDCAEGRAPGPGLTCEDADVDCDGDIDYCDVSRVFCGFMGRPDCCQADIPCGACCNSGANFEHPCLVISQEFCHSFLIDAGEYLGDGTVCEPWPCGGIPCATDADCWDGNDCTLDLCNTAGVCDFSSLPDGTPCSDESFCNGDETCLGGACASGPPRNCDDSNPCTEDACDPLVDACVHAPIGCNHNGVCDAPCENAENCPGDCAVNCIASRDLSHRSLAYCPGEIKTVAISLDLPAGTVTAAVEDSPPDGWTQVINISDGGEYDAANHKVKWGPLFAPFPGVLTYDVAAPVDAAGAACFGGVVSLDGGAGEPICGHQCIEESCCPIAPADEPQEPCAGCSDTCTGTPGDGRIELCEVVRYACAWKRGCNDDITGVSGGAYIWKVGECYCWDEAGMTWVVTPCEPGASACCVGAAYGQQGEIAGVTGSARMTMRSVRPSYDDGVHKAKAREFDVSVAIDPPLGTSAVALEIELPKGWVVRGVSDSGAWDQTNDKVKWGPFLSDEPRTVTVTVNGALRRAHRRALSGTVSFDGRGVPVAID